MKTNTLCTVLNAEDKAVSKTIKVPAIMELQSKRKMVMQHII